MSAIVTDSTYHNPVFAHNFPDPFILKHGNGYWAYSTGIWHDQRCFGILWSADLVHWEERAGAMAALPDHYPCYWAPEVSYYQGVFYLYYSVGDERTMVIRVATASHPAGPFVDSGHILTPEPFAIDPHIAEDTEGSRYLFYATDFLEHSHIGTGTVRARLSDPFTLAEVALPVTRARYDWQVYDPNRAEKGGVRWHTVEGPFVLRHKGRYYQMFSGGNWQNPSYGVSYATSATLDNAEEWDQVADGAAILPILRTLPDEEIIGPGHNSMVRGPDNRQWYCVYHRWAADGSGRQMALDPLDWAGERMVLTGPSSTPQPAPLLPNRTGFQGGQWHFSAGAWQVTEDTLTKAGRVGNATANYRVESSLFLLEFLFTVTNSLTFSLRGGNDTMLTVEIDPVTRLLTLSLQGGATPQTFPLPTDFALATFHRVRLEVNHRCAIFSLDDYAVRWEGVLGQESEWLGVQASNGEATFTDFAITYGWEERWPEGATGADLGWQSLSNVAVEGRWYQVHRELRAPLSPITNGIVKTTPFDAYEFVIALRVIEADAGGQIRIAPLWQADNEGESLCFTYSAKGWHCQWGYAGSLTTVTLPPSFDLNNFQLLRFRKTWGRLTLDWEGTPLLEHPLSPRPTQVAIYTTGAAVALDTVRLTVIPPSFEG